MGGLHAAGGTHNTACGVRDQAGWAHQRRALNLGARGRPAPVRQLQSVLPSTLCPYELRTQVGEGEGPAVIVELLLVRPSETKLRPCQGDPVWTMQADGGDLKGPRGHHPRHLSASSRKPRS